MFFVFDVPLLSDSPSSEWEHSVEDVAQSLLTTPGPRFNFPKLDFVTETPPGVDQF